MSHENELREIELSSGRVLHLSLAPFKDARALYQTISREIKNLKLDIKDYLTVSAGKDLVFTILASEEICDIAMTCAKRCLYGKDKEKVNEELFEGIKEREDYFEVLYFVIIENIKPFTKGLLQKYGGLVNQAKAVLKKGQA